MARLRIRLGALILSFCLLVAAPITNAQQPTGTVALRIPNGWHQIPSWMEPGMPFDSSAYYGIDTKQNREVPYLRAFLEINFVDACDVIPDVESTPDFQARTATARRRTDLFYELWERHVVDEDDAGKRITIDPNGIAALRTVLAEYDAGIELIRTAQQRENCFFHIEVDTASINSHQLMAREIARVLGCRCVLEPQHNGVVDDVRMLLRLKRDLQKLGETVAQMSLYASEEICFNWMVLTLLETPDLQKQQLDELIEVLSEHHRESQAIDPAVESARYQYMMLHKLFRQLETGEYDAQRRSDNLELNRTLNIPGMVILELTSLKNFKVNTAELRGEISTLAREVPEMAEMLEQYDQLQNQGSKEGDTEFKRFERQRAERRIDTSVLLPVLANRLNSMTPADYETEVSILRSRCRQITEACRLRFPESTDQLKILGERWTTDDQWKGSKLLRWFKPDYDFSHMRIKSALRTNAFLCLAAIKRWQLENAGENPTDLGKVMSAAGINSVPIDPYSGESLKMAVTANDVIIYSVGPDGDDDHAREEYDIYDPSRGKDDNGDVVFRLQR